MLILVCSFFVVWKTTPKTEDTNYAEYIKKQIKKSDLSSKEKSQSERQLLEK